MVTGKWFSAETRMSAVTNSSIERIDNVLACHEKNIKINVSAASDLVLHVRSALFVPIRRVNMVYI